jgi:Xaa-Pro aminopeptidase
VVGVLAVVGTFHLTMLGFVMFRAHSLAQLGALARTLVHAPFVDPDDAARCLLLVVVALPVVVLELVQERNGGDAFVTLRAPRRVQAGLYVSLALLLTFPDHGRTAFLRRVVRELRVEVVVPSNEGVTFEDDVHVTQAGRVVLTQAVAEALRTHDVPEEKPPAGDAGR